MILFSILEIRFDIQSTFSVFLRDVGDRAFVFNLYKIYRIVQIMFNLFGL